ncbi:MAG TPA: multicopper oxidase family protein [Acidobacteriaceae bacterium]|jgi:FtsP/CotA-like multicopper oxidase with cupredoxin domain|nr:multicopper oxidase family protein [Acidobacteriaceae bacterium]
MTRRINRRRFVTAAATIAAGAAVPRGLRSLRGLESKPAADVKLEIAPLKLEIAPKKVIDTVAYNGAVPGPLIRWPEGKPIVIDVTNHSRLPEIVHWHGQWIPSLADGAMEEGSPMIAPGATLRYSFEPRPAGFRWYHTHSFAGHHLDRGLYTGQFGCFYVEPKENPGAFDQEIFLTLHDWNAYMGGGGDASMDAVYDYATINGRMLGHGDPLRVREGQQVLLHVVNASATLTHWLALAGHEMTVVAMDGNAVPEPRKMQAVRLAPAERLDLVVAMKNPGVWLLGETRKDLRDAGMGMVVEYARQTGEARWIEPAETEWDYRLFAHAEAAAAVPDEVIPLLFESKFAGHGEFDYWTINGKSFPKTDTVTLTEGKRYRLAMTNRSMDDHPIHLHRHTFEVTSLEGRPMSGLQKDVVVVKAGATAAVDFTARNPGATLFHCHQQTHMDFGFMMLFRYA